MRTVKRFSPDVLDRFRRLGRGTGSYEAYIPWHRVTRGDPSSKGRSHLPVWHNRQIDLLSDKELITFLFATQLLFKSSKNDLREQFPLSLEPSPHELSVYNLKYGFNESPGTLDIAKQLGFKHPMTHGNGRSAPWVMTTDFLLYLEDSKQDPNLLAVSIKDKVPLTERVKQLLTIEKEYWNIRNVDWLFITPRAYHKQVADTLLRSWPWVLQNSRPEEELDLACKIINQYQGFSQTYLLEKIAFLIGDKTLAQHALWQSIWKGKVFVNFQRGWRPHLPLLTISEEEFNQENPIFSRRTAWI